VPVELLRQDHRTNIQAGLITIGKDRIAKINIDQLPCALASVSTSTVLVTTQISSIADYNEHHQALLGRYVIVVPSINVQTYLRTRS